MNGRSRYIDILEPPMRRTMQFSWPSPGGVTAELISEIFEQEPELDHALEVGNASLRVIVLEGNDQETPQQVNNKPEPASESKLEESRRIQYFIQVETKWFRVGSSWDQWALEGHYYRNSRVDRLTGDKLV